MPEPEKPADAFVCGLIDASLEEFQAWLDAHPAAALDEYRWPEPGPPEVREHAKAKSTS
jgi:hypothetical protein